MAIKGYQFDNMIVHPKVDAKLYFALQGDIFYRNIGSKTGGRLDSIQISSASNGKIVTITPSSHVVAGRLVEITENMTFTVPFNSYLAFTIDLTKTNSPSGTPFTSSYSVLNNQLSLTVISQRLTQSIFNTFKNNFATNNDLQQITVPIYSPDMTIEIEAPVGYSHAVRSDYESFRSVAWSEFTNMSTLMSTNQQTKWNEYSIAASASVSSAISNNISTQTSTNNSFRNSLTISTSDLLRTTTTSVSTSVSTTLSTTSNSISTLVNNVTFSVRANNSSISTATVDNATSILSTKANELMPTLLTSGFSSYAQANNLGTQGVFSTLSVTQSASISSAYIKSFAGNKVILTTDNPSNPLQPSITFSYTDPEYVANTSIGPGTINTGVLSATFINGTNGIYDSLNTSILSVSSGRFNSLLTSNLNTSSLSTSNLSVNNLSGSLGRLSHLSVMSVLSASLISTPKITTTYNKLVGSISNASCSVSIYISYTGINNLYEVGVTASLSGLKPTGNIVFSVNGSNTPNPPALPSGLSSISPFNMELLNSNATTGVIMDFLSTSMPSGFTLNMSAVKPDASAHQFKTKQIINLGY